MNAADRKAIQTDKAPKALGPYSVAIQLGELVFASGQAGIDPSTNELAPGGIEPETHQVLTNLKNVLEAAGSRMENVVKTTVFLTNMGDFAKMNAIYAAYFTDNFPARSTVQVSALPKGAMVEIECIAFRS
ncbi:MAG TPA: RidA family protein [Anaerolineaceae bacterium]|jgi:2-iminobutanoate/2-iminopropanoate deaminase